MGAYRLRAKRAEIYGHADDPDHVLLALPEKLHVPSYSSVHVKQKFESCPIIATEAE